MKPIDIIRVTPKDINQLQNIGRQTFYESFAAENSEENMENYLNHAFSVAKVTAEISDKNTLIYFAKLEGNVIGYLKLNIGDSQKELQDTNSLEIERIYVLREFQGRNIGQLLYEKAIEVAKEKNVDYVWLGVWEKNPRAIKFYQRNGFVAFDKHIFMLGNDPQTDILMKLKLDNSY